VQLGVGGELQGWPTVVFVIGLLLTAVLLARRTRGAILIGIVVTTVISIVVEAVFDIGPSFVSPDEVNTSGWQLNVPTLPEEVFQLPDLSLLGDFSLFGGIQRVGWSLRCCWSSPSCWPTSSTRWAPWSASARRPACSTRTAGCPARTGSCSSTRSPRGRWCRLGVLQHQLHRVRRRGGRRARTGLASVFTGLLFLVALFVTPLVSIVPFEAAAPALVIVGFLLITQVRNIDFDDYAIAIPPSSPSCSCRSRTRSPTASAPGFVSYALLKATQGRAREVSPLLWIIAALFLVYFGIGPIEAALVD
jgi:AGZA family xanthine/uracil permease-like MFS transporter